VSRHRRDDDEPGQEARYRPPAHEPPRYEPPPYEPPRYEAPPARTAPAYRTPAAEPAYQPPAYQRPEYGQVPPAPPAEPPLAGYVTRRPAPPLPSASRARKPPKAPPQQAPPRHPPPAANRAGRLRLRVNPITCDGHGLCAELLPELLTVDDWGYPAPVVTEVPAELESHAQRAAQQCPTLAIVLERRRPRRDGT
jgi:ferredoxin